MTRAILPANDQTTIASGDREQWLTRYYVSRAAFSAIWVAAALTVGRQSPALAAGLLILYPAWDAAANLVDAARNGGLANNRSQAVNVIVSAVTTAAVIVALTMSMNWVLGVFGLWAIFSGLLQLTTAVHCQYRRICRPRRLLLPGFGRLAERHADAAEAGLSRHARC
jgi:hypothetical protein